jgi:hypothetical protein
MKKYFVFIVVFFLLGGISVQAQTKFGIKAGVNLSSVSLDGNIGDNFKTENFTGFQVGPMIEFMTPLIGIDLAVLYSQQGFNFLKNNERIDSPYQEKTLEIPLNLKLKLALIPKLVRVYGTAGPYINFRLSDNLKDLIPNVVEDTKAKSFGAGLNFGFGVELFTHLQVGANYQMGLTDNYSDIIGKLGNLDTYTGKSKTAVWSITAAYLF